METTPQQGNGAAAQDPGTVTRESFDGQEMTVLGETAAVAVAAQAKAAVEARYIVAMRRPRDLDDVRVKLLKECRRPSLAKVAIYSKPIGGQKIQGLSVRFVETALRCMGNIVADCMTVFDGKDRRIVRITLTDLESNVTYPKDVTIEKVVERTSLADGRMPISSRKNSYGKTTYLVPATEDEMLNKENALVSKAIRTNGLRLIPGDLQDEALEAIRKTVADRDATDPDTARREIADAFAALAVMPSQLAEYLSHDLAQSSPAEIQELRTVYTAIRDGESTWMELLSAKLGKGDGPDDEGDGGGAGGDPKTQALRDKLASRKTGGAAPPDKTAGGEDQAALGAARERVNRLFDELEAIKVGAGKDALWTAIGDQDLVKCTIKDLEEAETHMATSLKRVKERVAAALARDTAAAADAKTTAPPADKGDSAPGGKGATGGQGKLY